MRSTKTPVAFIGLFLSIAVLSTGVQFKNVFAGGAAPSQEIDIKEIENKDKIPGITVNFFVKGKPAQVWKWISGVEKLGLLFPAVKKIEKIKEIDKNTTLYKYNLESALGMKIFNVKRTVDKKDLSISWIRTEGDLTYYAGSWKIKASKEYPGYVDCTYTNFVNAAWYVPYWKVKSTSKDNANAMVPSLRKLVAGK